MRKKVEKKEHIDMTVYQDKTMETVMHDSMIPYSEHVILDRAIPRVEDGLKPVQKKSAVRHVRAGPYPRQALSQICQYRRRNHGEVSPSR